MTTGILLMTFGSAVTADDVPRYLQSVRGGTKAPGEVIAEFRRRYDLVGRSPLIDITAEQAEALQRLLDAESGGGRYTVRMGMLHSAPQVDDAVAELVARGASEIVGIILSPQYSPQIMAGYGRELAAAGERHDVRVSVAGPWYDTPAFIACIAESVVCALRDFEKLLRPEVPVIFTAHSLPQRVVDRDPAYIASLHQTARLVATAAHIDTSRWQFAYQSAGHSPEEWLKPDFKELLPALRDAGWTEVLIVPTQFVTDHLEVLYDIDIAGLDEARKLGMTFRRTAMPNASARFIRALADVVDREPATVR